MQNFITANCGTVLATPCIAEFKREVTALGSPFFSRDTMYWFGTRNLAVFGGGATMIGCDTKAPDGVGRYWVRYFTVDGDRASAHLTERYDTRDKAKRAAVELAAMLRADALN